MSPRISTYVLTMDSFLPSISHIASFRQNNLIAWKGRPRCLHLKTKQALNSLLLLLLLLVANFWKRHCQYSPKTWENLVTKNLSTRNDISTGNSTWLYGRVCTATRTWRRLTNLPRQNCLPSNAFYNDLSESHISESEYEHAQTVWKAFNMDLVETITRHVPGNRCPYIIRCYVRIFESVHAWLWARSEAFMSLFPNSVRTRWCVWSRQKSVFWKTQKCTCLWNRQFEAGVATISQRHAVSNNPYLLAEPYDPSKEHSYIIYTDANNLYGLALSRPPPISDFKFLSEEEIEQLEILSIPQDVDTGYFSEEDLDYPEYLHREHNSLPLAPENIVITRDMLFDVTIEMGEKFDSKFLPQRKLCPNLMDIKKYVLYYTNLQFYIKHGMILRKIHRVLAFTQSRWIEPYIRFNAEKRKNSTDTFSKDLYKLLSNSASILLISLNNTSTINLFVS